MLSENKSAFYFLCIAFLLALMVILLGAYTRLKDAGLGCPDWPGCYGRLTLPKQPSTLHNAPYIGQTLNPTKAWPEMLHRYAAATLAMLSFGAIVLIIYKHKLSQQPVWIATILLFLLFFQGLLGKWTVTLRLHPLIVMSHLLGGLALLSLLWILILRLSRLSIRQTSISEQKLKRWAAFGLLLVILQISLGGWTSANYAAFVCPDFPLCQGQWWPAMNFTEGFHLWLNTNINYEGGILSHVARTAIQMSHRIMAVITSIYLGLLVYKLFNVTKRNFLRGLAVLLVCLLGLQISLGALNVLWMLPLPIAMAHNAVAALLLLTIITLNISLSKNNTK
ncbi:COX15/CtaA family protein [Rickettsiella endosymbiont of Miltochrista miniata]|uniref:COX15/CtaA family protein n=1 Tax=Rickettsiella endosymbiont of Miltochrista miniata TaxID=3066239 RepID=UPI00313E0B74